MTGGLVPTIKHEGTRNKIRKARFVISNQRDIYKDQVIHNISLTKQHTTKSLVGISTIFTVNIFSTKVTQAHT